MKNLILTTAFGLLLFALSCKDNTKNKVDETINSEASKNGIESKDSEKTGTFSIDGKEYSAKTETQYFGDKEKGNFSVLCQHNNSDNPTDANFELLQITFVNEKDATSSALKIYDGGSSLPMTEPEPGIVSVSLSGVGNGLGDAEFTGSEKSTGSISVKNNTVTLKDVVLYNSKGEKKTVNASLPY